MEMRIDQNNRMALQLEENNDVFSFKNLRNCLPSAYYGYGSMAAHQSIKRKIERMEKVRTLIEMRRRNTSRASQSSTSLEKNITPQGSACLDNASTSQETEEYEKYLESILEEGFKRIAYLSVSPRKEENNTISALILENKFRMKKCLDWNKDRLKEKNRMNNSLVREKERFDRISYLRGMCKYDDLSEEMQKEIETTTNT